MQSSRHSPSTRETPAEPDPADLAATDAAARLAALVIERFRATKALRESEDRMRRLVKLTSDWEWEQDAHFRFTRVDEFQGEQGRPATVTVGRTRWENPWLRPPRLHVLHAREVLGEHVVREHRVRGVLAA